MSRKKFDPREAIKRFHLSSAGKPLEGVDDTVISYKKKRRQKTVIVRATWKHVLIFAALNGLAISITKAIWFHYFGRPEIISVYSEEDDKPAPSR